MARTRGISGAGVIHADEGELLDKEGKPINPVAHQSWTGVSQQPNPDAVPEDKPPVVAEVVPEVWHCTSKTISRSIDGWEAIQLMGVLLGDMQIEIDAEKWRALPADLRRHFMRGPIPAAKKSA